MLKGHSSWIRCVQADEYKVVSGSSDRDIRLWSVATGQVGLVWFGLVWFGLVWFGLV